MRLQFIRIGCFLLFLLISGAIKGQYKIKGKVVDGENNKPLPFSSVFINNTTIGMSTDTLGNFSLDVPSGTHEVIAQYVGYEPVSFKINTNALAPSYLIKLKPQEVALAEVEIKAERDEAWYRNLEMFKRLFLGESQVAKKCEILNPKVLVIDYDKYSGVMKVYARDKLQIRNPALGYTLQYILADFEYNRKTGRVFFAGYPLFQPVELTWWNEGKIKRARERAYNGSIMHFLRSLIEHSTKESGFRMNPIIRKKNPERPSDEEIDKARALYKAYADPVIRDSLMDNFLSKRSLPKHIDMLDKNLLADSDVLQQSEDGTYYIDYEHLIQVIYTEEKEEVNYVGANNSDKRGPQTSVINLIDHRAAIEPNGTFKDPTKVFYEGYFGWEKVGDMLPLGYDPSNN